MRVLRYCKADGHDLEEFIKNIRRGLANGVALRLIMEPGDVTLYHFVIARWSISSEYFMAQIDTYHQWACIIPYHTDPGYVMDKINSTDPVKRYTVTLACEIVRLVHGGTINDEQAKFLFHDNGCNPR